MLVVVGMAGRVGASNKHVHADHRVCRHGHSQCCPIHASTGRCCCRAALHSNNQNGSTWRTDRCSTKRVTVQCRGQPPSARTCCTPAGDRVPEAYAHCVPPVYYTARQLNHTPNSAAQRLLPTTPHVLSQLSQALTIPCFFGQKNKKKLFG